MINNEIISECIICNKPLTDNLDYSHRMMGLCGRKCKNKWYKKTGIKKPNDVDYLLDIGITGRGSEGNEVSVMSQPH